VDIFGDNGMISVVICKPIGPEVWEIDTWLMSCRVLGRGVETMVLRQILLHARKMGIKRLKGFYYPTNRNKLVANHYATLGFTLISQDASGATQWEIDVNEADPEPAPMEVRSLGFECDREPLNA
jgi:predicted enzyme involved in methoxymalonyl-ACP biosynthesis